ncbi:MAG: DUF2490 domain-containing protein [Flavobacteriales bacterium]
MRAVALSTALVLVQAVRAQHVTAVQSNAWASLNVQVQVGDRWWVVQEEQFRRSNGFADPMQAGFLFGVEHRKGPWSLQPGYAYWINYPYGTFRTIATQREHRFWLQAAFKHAIGSSGLEHRLRLEDRLLERFAASSEGPRSQGFVPVWRLRYRAQLTVPLNKKKDVAGELTGVLAQEVFLRFGDPAFVGAFDQTRSSAQLAWRCSGAVRVLAGYQFQYLVRANGVQREDDHTFIAGIQLRFPRSAGRSPDPAGMPR